MAAVDFFAHGTTVVINALTERKGAKTALITTDGLSRRARDRARQPPGLLQPGLREAAPVRASLSAPRAAGPHELPGKRPRRSILPACRPSSTTFAPRASRRSPSACCTPTPIPAHEQAPGRRSAPALAGSRGRRLAPDHPRMARVRAHQHDGALRLRAADRRALSRRLERGLDGQGFAASSTSCSRTAASTRSSDQGDPDHHGRVGPASGFWGAAELGRLIGEPNVLALDIGGTTAKCSLIEDGQVRS